MGNQNLGRSITMNANDWYNLGRDLEDCNSIDEAIHAYNQAIVADTSNDMADAHVNLGRLYHLQNNNKEARSHYETALLMDPDHHLAKYNLGIIYEDVEISVAMKLYKEATTVRDAYYNLARICEIQGDEFSAFRYLRIYDNMSNG
jgi:tetratricopeptide (TPR) repeat protein